MITTCSPRNTDLVRSCGAKHVLDYNDAKVIQKIREMAPNLEYVFDTIGNTSSSSTASRAFGDRKGHLCTVRPGKANTENVTPQTLVTDVLVWTAFLKDHRYAQFHWPVSSRLIGAGNELTDHGQASEEDHALASELFEKLPQWLEYGKIKPNKTKVMKGLNAVPQGFQEYRDGKISAYKVVYEL